jgi:hypothetical protein
MVGWGCGMNNSQVMAIAINLAEAEETVSFPILTAHIFPELDKMFITNRLRFEYEMQTQPKQNGLTQAGFRRLFELWQAEILEELKESDPWLYRIRELAMQRKAHNFSFLVFQAMGVLKTSEASIREAIQELLRTGELQNRP